MNCRLCGSPLHKDSDNFTMVWECGTKRNGMFDSNEYAGLECLKRVIRATNEEDDALIEALHDAVAEKKSNRPAIKDWPKWAKWAAMDEDGQWWWCDKKPTIHSCGTMWACEATHRFFHPTEVPDWDGDWKDSLVGKEEGV